MKRHLALVLSAIVWLVFRGQANATVNEWSTTGPEGGNIHALAIDPWIPDNVLAGTETRGIFRSTDAAGRWSFVFTPTGPYKGGWGDVSSLAFDPNNFGTVYAASFNGGGVSKSSDGGRTWRIVTGPDFLSFSAVVIDPRDSRTVYAGDLKSSDGGETWDRYTGLYFQMLVSDPGIPNTLYAGNGSGVFKSENGGSSWMGTGLPKEVTALAMGPISPNILYAATRDGFYTSGNRGLTWSAVANIGSSHNRLFWDLAINPVSPTTFYVASNEGIFKTTDSGGTWTRSLSAFARTLKIDPARPEIIYAGTDSGILKSTDGGATWSERNAGLVATPVAALAIDPRTPAIVYAAGLQGVFKSMDRAASWTNSARNGYGRSIVIDPSNPDILYLAGGVPTNGLNVSLLSKSLDGGVTWNRIESGLSQRSVRRLAINPLTPTTLYAGMTINGGDGYGFFKTIDGGINWTTLNRIPIYDVSDMVLDPRSPDTIYAAQGSVYKSPDGGATWITLDQGPIRHYAMALAVDPQTSTLYMGRAPGLLKSIDGGGQWTMAGLDAEVIRCVAVHPRNSDILYAGTDHGVFASQDAGGSWNSLNTGLDSLTIQALSIDPQDPTIVHAATDSGVYTIDRNSTPVANAGSDQFVRLRGPGSGQASLDASGSADPDGDALSFSWSWAGGRVDGVRPIVDFPLGTTDVTLTVSDPTGAVSQDTVQVTVCRGRDPLHPKGCNRASGGD